MTFQRLTLTYFMSFNPLLANLTSLIVTVRMKTMITPRFSLSQDENSVTITIRAPYCCLRELDVDVDNNTFLFVCKPYYLRLHLPGCIVENDGTKSSFDSDSGEFTFKYEKAIPGENFSDLELITKFLVPNLEAYYNDGPKITLFSSERNLLEHSDITECLNNGCGFALQSHKSFITVSSEFSEVFEIDPSDVSLKERRKMRLQYEQGKFDMEHYLGDFIEDEEILNIICQNAPWANLDYNVMNFTDKELDFLKNLKNTEYNLTEEQMNYVHNGLIDILYAYCYDQRSTYYEKNSESGWTIVKLAATFCWLDVFENPKEVLVTAFRRSLIYPLHRNYKLSVKILEDLINILKLGEKFIIKSLIDIYYIFLGGDCCRYILNDLFIQDYIIYILKWDRNMWQSFLNMVFLVEIKKEDLGLNLLEIEGFRLDHKFSNLKIIDYDSDDSSNDSCDSSNDSDNNDSKSDSCSTD